MVRPDRCRRNCPAESYNDNPSKKFHINKTALWLLSTFTVLFHSKGACFYIHFRIVREWLKELWVSRKKQANFQLSDLRSEITGSVRQIGSPLWNERFGWHGLPSQPKVLVLSWLTQLNQERSRGCRSWNSGKALGFLASWFTWFLESQQNAWSSCFTDGMNRN